MVLTRSILLGGLVSLTAQCALAASSSFKLYAYGSDGADELGGYPLLEKDGLAYAVRPEVAQVHPEYLSVNYTKDTSDTTKWIATPANSTLSSNTTLALGIDTDADSNGAIGFTAGSNSSWSTTGWVLYGSTALYKVASGDLVSKFFANNDTGIEGVWALTWNEIGADEGFSVALRTIGKSSTST